MVESYVPWCATEPEYSLNDYGYCLPNCPIEKGRVLVFPHEHSIIFCNILFFKLSLTLAADYIFIYLTLQILVINCVWGDWGRYTSCSKSCGGGTQTRTRVKTTEEQNGGSCAGGTLEVNDCNTDSCPGMPRLLRTSLSEA